MEPTSTAEAPAISETPPQPRGIAPAWHTVLFIVMFAALSLGGTKRTATGAGHAHWPIYLETIVMQWLLVGFIVWGLALRGRKLRDLIGGRWNSAEAVLTDVGVAIGFFFANLMVRAAAAAILLALNGGLKASSMAGLRHVAKVIGPQSKWELLLFMGVALTAGFCEEIMFRGYLQQQFAMWTKSTALGVIVSAVLFTLGHAYQGWFLASQVGLLGLMLGILAAWRKSLRPGIIAHGAQDIISGVLSKLFFSGAQ
jgi:membrane protease YdiL (CAAX protease family)